MDIRNSILDAPPSRRSGYYIIADGQRSGLWILLDTFVASQAIAPSLQALHQSLPLRHVAAARLAFDHRRMALLPPLVSSMPSLTTLVLRCPRTATEGDERAMLSTVVATLRAATAPLLVSLAIDAAFAVPAGALDPLVRMTQARAAAGCALRELAVCAPGLSEEDLRLSRAFVPVVRVEEAAGVLWCLRTDDRWRIKNDYWRMYDENEIFQRFPPHWD
ncbi:hypothetical protein TRAPUB_2805 [Trametes pubescens]|uniref:Uncharacterized protein n=1 Tax=Trametes pubescens TaxID=154538 RepID=A0A1M2VFM8_TRAPU|nr:hypothetical protein TRAPUB_2805 [Trametes pubescens]